MASESTAIESTYVVRRLGSEGDGIVETPDGPVFVPGALPGDRVTVAGGRVTGFTAATGADRRADMLCPHVGRCGGCSLQHLADELYARWKPTLLAGALAQHGIDAPIAPVVQVGHRTRRRAVLTAIRQGRSVEIGFRERQSHRLEPITACAVLLPEITASLPAIREIAGLLLQDKGEAHVTVLATRHGLDVAFDAGAAERGTEPRSAVARVARGHPIARLSLRGDPLFLSAMPVLDVAGIDVLPPPGAFVQAVRGAEEAMQAIVGTALAKAKRVADLFAGLGTFTFPAARRARVLAVDSDSALIAALGEAARKAQGLKAVETKVRDLLRDPLSPRELDAFDAVVLDPPRAGAKAQAEAIARSGVKTVVAVSCNPATLARDLRILVDGGLAIEAVTPIDQFLFTPHLETVAVLRRGRPRT